MRVTQELEPTRTPFCPVAPALRVHLGFAEAPLPAAPGVLGRIPGLTLRLALPTPNCTINNISWQLSPPSWCGGEVRDAQVLRWQQIHHPIMAALESRARCHSNSGTVCLQIPAVWVRSTEPPYSSQTSPSRFCRSPLPENSEHDHRPLEWRSTVNVVPHATTTKIALYSSSSWDRMLKGFNAALTQTKKKSGKG